MFKCYWQLFNSKYLIQIMIFEKMVRKKLLPYELSTFQKNLIMYVL